MSIQLRVGVVLATDVRANDPVGASASERDQVWGPEADDEVVVGFANPEPRAAYVVGSLWHGNDKAPADAHEPSTRHHTVSATAKPL